MNIIKCILEQKETTADQLPNKGLFVEGIHPTAAAAFKRESNADGKTHRKKAGEPW